MLKSHSDASINLILTSTSTPHSEHIDFTAAGKVVLAQLRREKTTWRVEVLAAVVVVVAHVLYVCVFESVWLHGWERYYAKKDRNSFWATKLQWKRLYYSRRQLRVI